MPESMELPPAAQRLFDVFRGVGDVPIPMIHKAVFGDDPSLDTRGMQQRIGTPISRLNRRLRAHGLAVKPGQLKLTYRLISL